MFGNVYRKYQEAKLDALKRKREKEGEKAKLRGEFQRRSNEIDDYKKDIKNIESNKPSKKVLRFMGERAKVGAGKMKKEMKKKKKKANNGLFEPGRGVF